MEEEEEEIRLLGIQFLKILWELFQEKGKVPQK